MTFAAVLFLTACGNGKPDPIAGCSASQNGILWISWTIGGQPADSTACAPISSLSIIGMPTAEPGCGFMISDVSCPRGTTPFEYDYLPEGATNIEIDALTSDGSEIKRGTAFLTIATAKPPAAIPIDLR
jgi:hypothetical protein